MKTARPRFAFLFCAALATIAPAGGCTVGSKTFSMDSISKMPFFGLELKERKPKSAAPSYNSISQSAANAPRIEAALGIGSSGIGSSKPIDLTSKSVDLVKTGDGRHGIPRVSTAVRNEVSASDRGPKRVANELPPESIPLPRTDEIPARSDQRTAPAAVDFQ